MRSTIVTAADVGKWASFDNGPWLQIVAVSGDIIYVAGDFAGVTGIAGDLLISRHPHSTGGQLTTALAYSSGVTTLEDAAAQFAAYMVGWQVMLNPAQPVLRTISAVPSATQLQFAGDGVNLAAAGDFYRVFSPPGVMGDANGANWGHQHCDVRYGCSVSFGWAGYRYFAPVAGFVADHSGGGFAIHSRQGASINLVGNYHCWNRVYSPYLGRWTTPDPLASPWWNLWDYVGNNPLQYTDATGLTSHTKWLTKSSGCTLCIHSNAREGGDLWEGHSWLSLYCDSWGPPDRSRLRTYGVWPTKQDGTGRPKNEINSTLCGCGGLDENREKKNEKYGFGIGSHYYCKTLTYAELLRFLDQVESVKKRGECWTVFEHCGVWAARIFNAAIFPRRSLFAYNTNRITEGEPVVVGGAIRRLNKKESKTDEPEQSTTDPFGGTRRWVGGYEVPPKGHKNPVRVEEPRGDALIDWLRRIGALN